MSHDATAWAIKQKGLKPAAKLLLWHLCDHFNPDDGCFPRLDTLAKEMEMSRRAVQDNLAALEALGLIRVEKMPRRDGQLPRNRYRLAFEADFGKPSDPHLGQNLPWAKSDKSLGQNLPPNLVNRTSNRKAVFSGAKKAARADRRATPEDADLLTAQAIRDGKRFLLSRVSAAKATALVERGLVTADECKRAGVL